MKTIGLLGGMSWESTLSYYKAINEGVKSKLGGLHYAKICLYSVDFYEIEQYQRSNNWEMAVKILSKAAQNIEAGGADFLVMCTNTMHKVAQEIQEAIHIPLLHIADATAEVILKEDLKTVGLLGTKYTMEEGFYKGRLIADYDLSVITPEVKDRKLVNNIIFDELCLGKVVESSKKEYLRIIDGLMSQGAEAIIFGCTEIGLLVSQEYTSVPLFDTTSIHAQKAVEYALS